MAAGQRSWAGTGMIRNIEAMIRPMARPSSARSTTIVASTVQKRWPWREATYARMTSPARRGRRLLPM